ncbi:hypothetical protein ACWGKU_06330 [Kitasatospora sp. NPDC054768]
MTRYCVDPARHELIATWGTGQGDLASRIAAVPAGTDLAALSRLTAALTQLSAAAWRTYTHPAGAADSLEVNSEGWRREEERKAFAGVAAAVTTPNLPQGGSVIVEYSPVLENAHRVGDSPAGEVRLDEPVVDARLREGERAQLRVVVGLCPEADWFAGREASAVEPQGDRGGHRRARPCGRTGPGAGAGAPPPG